MSAFVLSCLFHQQREASSGLIRYCLQVFYAYTYSTAGWLALQSIPLVTVPEMMTTMLSEETRPPSCKSSCANKG